MPGCGMAEKHFPQIVFSGVYFAGNLKTSRAHFSHLNTKKNHQFLREVVNNRLKNADLKFNLIPAWGKEGQKSYLEVYHPLSLIIVITDEIHCQDNYTLRHEANSTEIIKNYVDVGLTAIFFTPCDNTDRIEYSLPVIAEDILIGDLSETKILADQFRKTYARAAGVLVERLSALSIRMVEARVTKVEKNGVRINAGAQAGVLPGIFINLPNGVTGTVATVNADDAFVTFAGGGIKDGDPIVINVVKSDGNNTYQVQDVTFSSERARKSFARDTTFKTLCAQWYSDFLSDRKGMVVLPPKTGAIYAAGAKEGILSAYGLEGDTFEFSIPDAKNQIVLDISGLAKQMVDGNMINQVWIFKAWVQQDINGIKKEVDEYITEEIIVGVKEINERAAFRNVIQQTLAKLAASN